MEVLFERNQNPFGPSDIRHSIEDFGHRYNQVVQLVIENSAGRLNKGVFCENIATLIPNFKMTRKGPFEGVKIIEGALQDPKGIIAHCWRAVGESVIALRELLNRQNKSRARVLVEMANPLQEEVAGRLWAMFKKVVPLCMGQYTYGLVGASKILFAVLPEVALPIDNNQWLHVFKTIDYGDIIMAMASEIAKWEESSGRLLDDCSPYKNFTLPAIYNVMAMKARPARRK
jgi:hypothetical protein